MAPEPETQPETPPEPDALAAEPAPRPEPAPEAETPALIARADPYNDGSDAHLVVLLKRHGRMYEGQVLYGPPAVVAKLITDGDARAATAAEIERAGTFTFHLCEA